MYPKIDYLAKAGQEDILNLGGVGILFKSNKPSFYSQTNCERL